MEIITFNFNNKEELISNCYILIDQHKKCLVVDPSCKYDGVINYIKKNNLKLMGVLLTHAHFDHMKGLQLILDTFRNVKLFVHYLDEPGLNDPYLNCSNYDDSGDVIINYPAITIKDKDIIDLLDEKIEVIHTPYHTIGSVCYYLKDSGVLLSGDTLFKMVIGRCDLPTSVPKEKDKTFNKLLMLPGDTKVYPGHGVSTTIGNEARLNAFIKR